MRVFVGEYRRHGHHELSGHGQQFPIPRSPRVWQTQEAIALDHMLNFRMKLLHDEVVLVFVVGIVILWSHGR